MSINRLNIAVLVSGGGSNLQALIDAESEGYFKSNISLVISNKKDAYALVRAKRNNIKTAVLNEYDSLNRLLEENDIDLVVLAGYLKIIDIEVIEKYKDRIINIHPSLLPKYGGKGMYGVNVHKAVLNANEIESGATVHKVTELIDVGEIVIQKKINIEDCKTPEDIQLKVLKIEHEILKKAIKLIEEE